MWGLPARVGHLTINSGITELPHNCGVIAVTEDPFIRKLLGDVLKKHGYRVVGSSASNTIEMIESGREPVELVITNEPGEFMSVAGKVPLLYLAAVPDPAMGSHFAYFRALSKPFRPEELLAAVEELTGVGVA